MADIASTEVFSHTTKHNLPTDLSIMEEGKRGQPQESTTNAAASPNIHQKLVTVATYNVFGATSVAYEANVT